MLRVTADTNVLVSGLVFYRGKPFRFLEMARRGQVILTVSEPILDELEHVLQRKFNQSIARASDSRHQIQAFARTTTPSVTLDVVKSDPDDNRILECAVSAGSDYIVTGDRHFTPAQRLRQYSNSSRFGVYSAL